MLFEFGFGDRFQDQSDSRRFRRGDFVSGEQVTLGALQSHPVHPHRSGGRAPYSRRRIAERGGLGRDDNVRAQHQIGAAADAPSLHRGDRRFTRVPEFHVHVDEPRNHPQVRRPSPTRAWMRIARAVARGLTSPIRSRRRTPVPPRAGESRARVVGVGLVDRGGEFAGARSGVIVLYSAARDSTIVRTPSLVSVLSVLVMWLSPRRHIAASQGCVIGLDYARGIIRWAG